MHNEIVWIGMLLLNFVVVWIAHRLFGNVALYVWMAVSIIIANILVTIQITIFGITATLGNIMYGTNFLITDSLAENHNSKTAFKAVWIGLFAMIVFTTIMYTATYFVPAKSDWAMESVRTIFTVLPRITFASLAAYLVSQLHDVWFFNTIKRIMPQRKYLWIRNNVSTLISQLIDTVVFCFLALWGSVPAEIFGQILISTYIVKAIVALLDTPVLYVLTYNKIPAFK